MKVYFKFLDYGLFIFVLLHEITFQLLVYKTFQDSLEYISTNINFYQLLHSLVFKIFIKTQFWLYEDCLKPEVFSKFLNNKNLTTNYPQKDYKDN